MLEDIGDYLETTPVSPVDIHQNHSPVQSQDSPYMGTDLIRHFSYRARWPPSQNRKLRRDSDRAAFKSWNCFAGGACWG